MEKTMVLYRKLWNFNLRRKNHSTLQKTIKLILTIEKTMILTKTFLVFAQL